MLPLPSTSRNRPRQVFTAQSPTSSNYVSLFTTLRTRARLTNLAVVIILGILTVSVVLNVSYLTDYSLSPPSRSVLPILPDETLHERIPESIEATIDRDPRYEDLDHLILVPGHALWIGTDPEKVEEDDQWILEAMQKGGSVKTYIKHIREGVEQLRGDTRALLVFSGGATRSPPSPPLSESQTYLSLTRALSLVPVIDPFSTAAQALPTLPPSLRIATEEYALDSYENLLFSVARFKEVTGVWPGRITVVGYGMKRRRFVQLHRAAIGFPIDRFNYIGIDDLGDTTAHYTGELRYGYTPFLSSPSGCHPPLLTKRLLRNPFYRFHPYHTSCPEIRDLLEWCPPKREDVFPPSIEEFEGGWSFGSGGHDITSTETGDESNQEIKPQIEEVIDVFEGYVPWKPKPVQPLDTGHDRGTSWGREQDR